MSTSPLLQHDAVARANLLRAAANEFADRGYAKTTSTRIVRRAGVDPNTTPIRKRALAKGIVKQAWIDDADVPDSGGIDGIRQALTTFGRLLILNSMTRTAVQLHQEHPAQFANVLEQWVDIVRLRISRAVVANELSVTTDCDRDARMFVTAITGVCGTAETVGIAQQHLPELVTRLAERLTPQPPHHHRRTGRGRAGSTRHPLTADRAVPSVPPVDAERRRLRVEIERGIEDQLYVHVLE